MEVVVCLYRFLVHACCRLTPPARRRGHPNVLASQSMPFILTPLLPLFSLPHVGFVAGLCLTTLARLPFRLGLGRERTPSLSSGLLVHLYSCPYSDTISLSAVIWIFVLYLFVHTQILIFRTLSRCCNIYVLLGSIVTIAM